MDVLAGTGRRGSVRAMSPATALVLVGPKWEFDGFYDDWFVVLMCWTMWYAETTPSSIVLREHKMCYIRRVLELLENEQLTVDEAERYIVGITEHNEKPTLPEGEGRLRICEKCGERMSEHDRWDRCPVPCLKCGQLLTHHSCSTGTCPCVVCGFTQCIRKGKEATTCASSE